MKSRIWILTFTAALIATPAHAAWYDADAAKAAWQQVKTTVTVKVNEWIDYWNGKPADQKPAVAGEPAPAGTGTATQASEATGNQGAGTQATANGGQPAANKPVAPISEAAKELRAQPLYSESAKNSSLKDVQAAKEGVKAAQILKVTPGRQGASKLPKSKVGVPTANLAAMNVKGVKKIQLLDIGTENLVTRQDFAVPALMWNEQKPSDFKKLPQPNKIAESEIKPWATMVVKPATPKNLQAGMRSPGHPVTLEAVQKVSYTLKEFTEVKEMPYQPLSEDEMKMVAALILYGKGKHCPMVLGLFHQLSGNEKMRLESNYHLGACAAELKMYQPAFDHLTKVIASEDKDYAASALTILSKDLPQIYEKEFYKTVKALKNAALIEPAAHDYVNYRAAKGAYKTGDYKSSVAYAEKVSAKSEFSGDARFLVGMNKFALGDKPGALKALQDLWTSLGSGKADSNLRAVTSVNLARMYFAQKKYDKALEHYMTVPKDHPLWVDALIEQGWTQIASDDFAGAIGNMYSLHSPYFKAVFQPESWVVRTIGYLNICQYGDAYKSLTYLEKDYREWYGKTSHYMQTKANGPALYSSVKSYIRGKSSEDVDGVPFQIWREMAHRKDFLNLQTALNEKVDEAKRYEGINGKLNEERNSIKWHAEQTKKRFDDLRAKIAKAKTDPVLAKSVDQMKNSMKLEKDYTIGYRFQLALLELGRQGYTDYQRKCQARLDNENAQLTARTGEVLLKHGKDMTKEMERVLENNEFLRYEVFAGSGENIRYQVAGGQTAGNNRIPAHIKPQKMMNWNFDGEMWEDEIGSYRSGLQNNCPKSAGSMRTPPAGGKPAAQASHSNNDDEE